MHFPGSFCHDHVSLLHIRFHGPPQPFSRTFLSFSARVLFGKVTLKFAQSLRRTHIFPNFAMFQFCTQTIKGLPQTAF